jgi:hypothetical protein
MGIVDGNNALVAARLVVAFGRAAHRLASLVVGKRDPAAVKRGEEATECAGLAGVRTRIGQLVGLKVAWAGATSIGTTRGPAVGF